MREREGMRRKGGERGGGREGRREKRGGGGGEREERRKRGEGGEREGEGSYCCSKGVPHTHLNGVALAAA